MTILAKVKDYSLSGVDGIEMNNFAEVITKDGTIHIWKIKNF